MNALALVAAKALPALSGSSLTYNPEKNVFLTCGYTSAAGKGNPYLRPSCSVLQHRPRTYPHLPQRYNTVWMGRQKGKNHCPEIMGRIQLESIL